MAFSMNGMSNAFNSQNSNQNQSENPPSELGEVNPTEIGFQCLKPDTRARVLKNAWPADALPPSYASLLAIASARAIFAAAGPDEVVIGKCQDARTAIYNAPSDSQTPPCETILSIPRNRPAYLAFSSDESCLVVADEADPQLYGYTASGLLAGSSKPAARLTTNAPLRAIVPNPDLAQGHLFAVVTMQAQLLIADLEHNQWLSAENGTTLADNVVCVAWSNKGKQLIAGRADGTAVQLTPTGKVVAEISKPPALPSDSHLAQIVWLENNVFFFNFTPSSPPSVSDVVSNQFILHTDNKRSSFSWQAADLDLFYPTIERLPASFLAVRLRNYAPHLSEVLFVASSISPDIATITKASAAFKSVPDMEKDIYAVTKPIDDTRWATMPVMESGEDGAPIGLALDLSDTMQIIQPLPAHPKVEDSVVPVPELVALDSDGSLTYWALIYENALEAEPPVLYQGMQGLDAIRKTFSDSDSQHTQQKATINSSTAPASQTPQSTAPKVEPPAAASTFLPMSNMGSAPSSSNDAKNSWTSTGFSGGSQQSGPKPSNPTAFGVPGNLGGFAKPSSTGAGATFGQSSFGQPGFGQPSPFGQASNKSSQPANSPFGAASPATKSPFSGFGNQSAPGFSSFASQSGFGSMSKPSGGSGFGSGGGFGSATNNNAFSAGTAATAFSKGPSPSPFGGDKPAQTSIFGATSGSSAFGKPTPIGGTNSSAFGSMGQKQSFKLESSFKKDETSKDVEDDQDDDSAFGFGKGLGSVFGRQAPSSTAPAQTATKESENGNSFPKLEQKTPPGTLHQPKNTTTPPVSSLFGVSHQSTTPQTEPKSTTGTNWMGGGLSSTTPKETPGAFKATFTTQTTTGDTPAKVQTSEPWSFGNLAKSTDSSKAPDFKEKKKDSIPSAPLPPDPFSKPGYQPGDTSASSSNSRSIEDVPLPPDFVPANRTASKGLETQVSDLPSELLSDDFEGSGEDVTGDVSPVEERDSGHVSDHVETSPESSFSQGTDRSPGASPIGGVFTNVRVESSKPAPRALFGELSSSQIPTFAPPKHQQASPRSPSPMRKPPRQSMLSRSPERSFSAPAPRDVIARKRQDYQQSSFATQHMQAQQQEAEMLRMRRQEELRLTEESRRAEMQSLEDDEDELLRNELAKPVEPSLDLEPFLPIDSGKHLQDSDAVRSDVPSQIEILYRDINSMTVTIGINARALSSYLQYQSSVSKKSWSDSQTWENATDASSEQWRLGDIDNLSQGIRRSQETLQRAEVTDVVPKLEYCQTLLNIEIVELRNRITQLRRSTKERTQNGNVEHAPLSMEQLAVQQDLRRTSAAFLTRLGQAEDDLVILRAKLADKGMEPAVKNHAGDSFGLLSTTTKRPSVEAVMNTVGKMTTMAEKRSADVDFLEAQLRKMNMMGSIGNRPQTPDQPLELTPSLIPDSPDGNSVYQTPKSNGARSIAGTSSRKGGVDGLVPDTSQWHMRMQRKKKVSQLLKSALQAKHDSQGRRL